MSAGPFAILIMGRTGSTLLTEALDSHPRVVCAGEWLTGVGRKKGAKRQIIEARSYLKHRPSDDCSAWGFKLKLSDVKDRGAFADVLRDSGASIIHLERKNRIKQVVSMFNAARLHAATADWNLYDPGARPGMFRIDPVEFREALAQVERGCTALREYVAALGLPSLYIVYEELLEDPSAVFVRAFSFLGVPPADAKGKAVKNTDDDLRKVLENFEELRESVAGSPYVSMFDEVVRTESDPGS